MYKDVNGKTGYTILKGISGKTYGNLKLLTSEERLEALDDGIAEYTRPAKPKVVLTPEQEQERQERLDKLRIEEELDAFMSVRDTINLLARSIELLEMKVDGIPVDDAEVTQLKQVRQEMQNIRTNKGNVE